MDSDDKPKKKRPERKVVETVHFNASGRKEDSAKNQEELQKEYLRDALAKPPTEGREYYYEMLLNLRVPADKENGLPSVEIFNPVGIRLADALWKFGYRRHPELEEMRWRPSAGMAGTVHEMDEGIYYFKDPETGEWPDINPLDYIDPDDILTEPDPENKGQFIATHRQSGHQARGKNRIRAHRALLEMLDDIEENGLPDEPPEGMKSRVPKSED
ncbi:hypothetical protein SEA_JONJAMES_148 [Gordonia Phage JonJames]|nr:hypothetical protein SEA_JONJAMES_148 [Gordonia Phage JonJames]